MLLDDRHTMKVRDIIRDSPAEGKAARVTGADCNFAIAHTYTHTQQTYIYIYEFERGLHDRDTFGKIFKEEK